MEVYPIQMYISVPSESELKEDIQGAQENAAADPENADYFNIQAETFGNELAVLEDPKNADINPDTLQGAENLINQMGQATKGLSQEAQALLKANPSLCQYGSPMLQRHWIPV